jgi:hypothetical protein
LTSITLATRPPAPLALMVQDFAKACPCFYDAYALATNSKTRGGYTMEVSTFELLYKPLTPSGGDIARRVFEGYFLTITNLEDQDYTYRIE